MAVSKMRLKYSNILCIIGLFSVFSLLLWFTCYEPPHNKVISFLLLLGWIVFLGLIFIFIPPILLSQANVTAKEISIQHNKIRKGIVSAFAVIAALSTIYLTWQSNQTAKMTLEISQKTTLFTLEQNQDKQVADIYSRSLYNLGSEELVVRLGAIAALERIARMDPSNYYWPVIHILTAYIRKYSPADFRHPHQSPPKDDIALILDFIQEGNYEPSHHDNDIVDLSNVDISYANLSGAGLSYAKMEHSVLHNVDFSQAKLNDASFDNSDLQRTFFVSANLQSASFYDSLLNEVDFLGADLTKAEFSGSIFGNPMFGLGDAKLYRADFCNKYDVKKHQIFTDCAKGLTCDDLKQAMISDATIIPEYLKDCSLRRIMDPGKVSLAKAVYYLQKGDIDNFLKVDLPDVGRVVYEYKSPIKYAN